MGEECSLPASGENQEPLDYTTTFPQSRIFPSPFPSIFIPIPLNTQQFAGSAQCVPTMITILDYWEGGPRERGGTPQVFQIDLLCILTLRVLPADGLKHPSPAPSLPFLQLLTLATWAAGSLSLSPSLTSCSLGSSLSLAVPEGERVKVWVWALRSWVSF